MKCERSAKMSVFASMFIFGTIGIFKAYIPLPNSTIALCRAVIGLLFLVLVLLCRRQSIDWKAVRKNLFWLVLSGVFLGYNWMLLFESYDHTTIAIGTLCYYMAPIFVILVSPFLLRESLNLRKILCIFAALVGMVCVSGIFQDSAPKGEMLKGILFGLAAAVLYASIILCNKQLKQISAYDKTILQLGVAAVSILPYCFLTGGFSDIHLNGTATLFLVLIGVLHTGVTYYLYFGSMDRISGQSAAIISYIDPAVAVFASVLFLEQPMQIDQWIGAALIIGAALFNEINFKRKRVAQ